MSGYNNYVDRYQPPRIPAGQGPSALAWITVGLGVGSWLALPLAGAVAAVICGFVERRKIAEGTSSPEGKSLVTLGLLFGGVQLLLAGLVVAGFLLFVAFLTLAAVMA